MARTDYGAILSTVIKDTSDAVREVNGTSSLIAPNQWGTLIRTMHSDSDYENALEQMIEETATGDIASFSDGANNIPVKSLVASIVATQSGSGTPSPTNIRPISGWSSVNVTRCGKNLFDKKTYSAWQIFGTYLLLKNTLPNTQLVMSFKDKDTSVDVTGCYMGFFQNSFTSGAPEKYRWCLSNGTPSSYRGNVYDNEYLGAIAIFPRTQETYDKLLSRYDIQIELGSSATTYEPYTGSTTTTDLGTTVYGGTLDVTTGVLTIDRVIVDLSTLYWSTPTNRANTSDLRGIIKAPTSAALKSGAIAEKYYEVPATTSLSVEGQFAVGTDGTMYFYRNVDTPTGNLVYPLTTPTTTQLTPQEVKSLLGSNNFYHDCNGQVAVTYRANGQLYVAQHT